MDKKLVALLIISVLVLGFVALIGVNSSQTGYGIFDTVVKILRGGKPGGSGPVPMCYVTPNPVTLGSDYFLIVGSGMKPNIFIDVFVSGSGGTGMIFTQTNATGGFSVTATFTAWLGTNRVIIKQYNRGKLTFLTECSFQVIQKS